MKFGMARDEVEITRWGEMMDLIACHAINNGAKPKKRKKTMEEILMMR